MSTLKDYVSIHLQLNQIDVWEVGSCNTLTELSKNLHIPKKAEDLNLSVFNSITGINSGINS